MKELTKKEKQFCMLCVFLGSPVEAARQAGYVSAKAPLAAAALLMREDIRSECRRAAKEVRARDLNRMSLLGLYRLAFGGIDDAVKLAGDPAAFEAGMDLFCISEIRRDKSGGLEFRLHDRAKALELLLQHTKGENGEDGVAALYTALNKSALEPDGMGDHAD